VQLVELVRDLAEKAKEAGFILTTVAFDVPGSIGGGYEKMRVEFQNSLHNDERMHLYQRERTSITGFGLKLRGIIETGRLVEVVMTRLVLLGFFTVRPEHRCLSKILGKVGHLWSSLAPRRRSDGKQREQM
jgi:hypothetical protein